MACAVPPTPKRPRATTGGAGGEAATVGSRSAGGAVWSGLVVRSAGCAGAGARAGADSGAVREGAFAAGGGVGAVCAEEGAGAADRPTPVVAGAAVDPAADADTDIG